MLFIGLSDFLTRMRQASKDYKKYKMNQNNVTSNNYSVMNQDNLTEYENLHEGLIRTEEDKNLRGHEIIKEDNPEYDEVIQPLEFMQSVNEKSDTEESNIEENEDKENVANPISQDKGGLLNYFFLSRLFA